MVLLHAAYLTDIRRKARAGHRREQDRARKAVAGDLDKLLELLGQLLDPSQPRSATLGDLLGERDEASLREAWEECRRLRELEERGEIQRLLGFYPALRRYLPGFYELPFRAREGSRSLRDALVLARDLPPGAPLPEGAPLGFVPKSWRKVRGGVDRALWELALVTSTSEALRSGDLYLPGSRRYASFWEFLEEAGHEDVVSDVVGRGAEPILAHLEGAFEAAAENLQGGLSGNRFASIREGKLRLSRDPAWGEPTGAAALRDACLSGLPHQRIEGLLREVEGWTGFSSHLRDAGSGAAPARIEVLHATLVAHGTNLGIAAMGASAPGISVDELRRVGRWFLGDEALRKANAALVDYHHRLDLSAVWGDGDLSSSDGQRFGVEGDCALGSFYPRYFGYYDQAVSLYTHTSNQHTVFGTRVISCGPREALYVLDGLLENDTVLSPREHATDTHGALDHVSGLCFLLGFTFMPRLRDLRKQHLYRVGSLRVDGEVDTLLRSAVDFEIVREQWEELCRVADALRKRTAPAHVVMDRLLASPANRLSKALRHLGRAVKTIYLLRFLADPALRRRVHRQLNRGEARHALAKRLFFGNQGMFRSGDIREMMNKANCLSLLSNAVVVWNTVKMGEILEALRIRGQEVLIEDLAYVSPFLSGHVIPNGTYEFLPDNEGVPTA